MGGKIYQIYMFCFVFSFAGHCSAPAGQWDKGSNFGIVPRDAGRVVTLVSGHPRSIDCKALAGRVSPVMGEVGRGGETWGGGNMQNREGSRDVNMRYESNGPSVHTININYLKLVNG